MAASAGQGEKGRAKIPRGRAARSGMKGETEEKGGLRPVSTTQPPPPTPQHEAGTFGAERVAMPAQKHSSRLKAMRAY